MGVSAHSLGLSSVGFLWLKFSFGWALFGSAACVEVESALLWGGWDWLGLWVCFDWEACEYLFDCGWWFPEYGWWAGWELLHVLEGGFGESECGGCHG